MKEHYKEILERLDQSFPPPKESLTLDEVAIVLGTTVKTLQNHVSMGKCPFPILRIGGRVLVTKTVLARVLAGMSFEGE